jgi:23S rRNA pseudouridine955/2504/2580 synthase
MMRKCTVEGGAPIRLKAWLSSSFPAMSKHVLASLLREKDIRINGKRMGEDTTLHPGDEVVLYVDDERLDGPPLKIAWLSENLVIAVKPPGISSKAEGEADMEELVGKYLQQRGERPFVVACHRLDNQTGGLMMLARDEATVSIVRCLMEAGKIRKTYHCIVKGTPNPVHNVLKAWLKKDEARSYVTVFDKPAPGARTAVTEYTVLQAEGLRSLLEVTLHTGRTHQIRVHLAHIGHPILGDDKYGDREFNKAFKARRQKLWASRLEFDFEATECPGLAGLAGKTITSDVPFINEIEMSDKVR